LLAKIFVFFNFWEMTMREVERVKTGSEETHKKYLIF